MDIRFLNLYTVYSYAVFEKEKKKIIFDHSVGVCFRSIFRMFNEYGDRIVPKAEYKVFASTDSKLFKENYNNYCTFNKQEIINHLRRLRSTFPELLQYKVEPYTMQKSAGYEIVLTVDSSDLQIHKYILTYVRYLYEACFTFILRDALRLSKLPEFRFVSIANLINVVYTCYPDHFPCKSYGHTLSSGYNVFYTRKELRDNISKVDSLREIYSTRRIPIKLLPEIPEVYSNEFWESEEEFNNVRLPVYKKAFLKLK